MSSEQTPRKTIRGTRDNELAAFHTDGRKLYVPLWNSDGEIIPSALTLAAVSIDQDGKTFPEGSFWLRNEHNRLKAGWTWANGYRDSAASTSRERTAPPSPADALEDHTSAPKRKSPRVRRTCPCTRTFLAKRADATYCSQPCRRRYSKAA
jgi:hypothetical protein